MVPSGLQIIVADVIAHVLQFCHEQIVSRVAAAEQLLEESPELFAVRIDPVSQDVKTDPFFGLSGQFNSGDDLHLDSFRCDHRFCQTFGVVVICDRDLIVLEFLRLFDDLRRRGSAIGISGMDMIVDFIPLHLSLQS